MDFFLPFTSYLCKAVRCHSAVFFVREFGSVVEHVTADPGIASSITN